MTERIFGWDNRLGLVVINPTSPKTENTYKKPNSNQTAVKAEK